MFPTMFPSLFTLFFVLLVAPFFVAAASINMTLLRRDQNCVASISSLSDVTAAVRCKTININSFTIPGGHTFELDLLDGTTVNLKGNLIFSSHGMGKFPGPLFSISGNDITFNGNNLQMDGMGPDYWDGGGGVSGVPKPAPLIKLNMAGKFLNLKVVNTPTQAFAVGNFGRPVLLVSGITIDNSKGNAPNAKSKGKPAAANTDGFDVNGDNIIIENSVVINQDDCFACNSGNNIKFINNKCFNGHGISVGSINSGATVSNVLIADNIITNSAQALRIKTKALASKAAVSNVTFSGNMATGIERFGFILDQSYPGVLSKAGDGVTVQGVHFTGKSNVLSLASSAMPVAINCGHMTCKNFDWSALSTKGGNSKANTFNNSPTTYSSGT